jgi:hypothetical protein
MQDFKKYFLMKNDNIINSSTFDRTDFLIFKSSDKEYIYAICITEHERIEFMLYDGSIETEDISYEVELDHVILESDDYDELDLFRRLRGYKEEGE